MEQYIREFQNSLETDENNKSTTPNLHEECPHWNANAHREVELMIQYAAIGHPNTLDRDKSWIPLQVKLKKKAIDERIAYHLFYEFGLLTQENVWHPDLLEFGLIAIISYTETQVYSDYVKQVQLLLLSERGETFFDEFFQYALGK